MLTQDQKWKLAATMFAVSVGFHIATLYMLSGKADKEIVDDAPQDLTDVYVPPIEVRGDPKAEGYRVIELPSRQVLLEGHINTVTEDQVADYISEHLDEIPDDKDVILHVRRGRIIKLELHGLELPEEEGDEEL